MQEDAIEIETTARAVSNAEGQDGLDTAFQEGSFEIEDVPTLPISHLDNSEVCFVTKSVQSHAEGKD